MMFRLLNLLVLFTLTLPSMGWSQCEPEDPDSIISPSRYLRALTLDLQGRVPTLEEYQRLNEISDVNDNNEIDTNPIDRDWIAELLEGSSFAQQATRLHHGMLWNNITNINLYNNRSTLSRSQGIYWRGGVAQIYRGGAGCLFR